MGKICDVEIPILVVITGDHTIHPPIEVLLPPTGVEPTPFWNSTSKVAGLQVHTTIPSCGLHVSVRANLSLKVTANFFHH